MADVPTVTLLDLPGLSARERAEPGFAYELAQTAERLGLDPNYLGAVMSLESGFDPSARNAQSKSTGLIQFMPATAITLGTSVDALLRMSARSQLPLVQKYFAMAGRAVRPTVAGDYYMATFLPAFVGADPSTVLASKGDPVYDQNRGLDADHDGSITVADVWKRIDDVVAAARARAALTFKKKAQARPRQLGLWFWCWGRLLSLRISGRLDGAGEPLERALNHGEWL